MESTLRREGYYYLEFLIYAVVVDVLSVNKFDQLLPYKVCLQAKYI
jgi:hypothetical protein